MTRVLIAGLGDTGTLTAIHLSRHVEVVGISAKPGLVSGQELGLRLARPDAWARDYLHPFDRFRGLDPVRSVHGSLVDVDLDARTVAVALPDGSTALEPYDVLVISSGARNGFWRRPDLQTDDEVAAALAAQHAAIATAGSVAIVGGGAAAVSTAAQVAGRWPDKRVDLYFPGDRALPRHHGRVWGTVERRLRGLGVGLHAGHRGVLPADVAQITSAPVAWTTGQPAVQADAVVWATGRVEPNTEWLPADLLDDDGFVRVTPTLQVPGRPEVFAVGDVAATDPLRTSARNSGHRLIAHNIRAHVAGRSLRAYRPPRRRWGSVLGRQPDGLQVFAPNGRAFRFPAWSVDTVLQPLIVRVGIYRGVRRGHGRFGRPDSLR